MGQKTVKKNELGNRYGLLTVVKEYPGTSGVGTYWICKCDCGNEVAVRGLSLRSGACRSCGCYRRMSPAERAAAGLAPHGKERTIVTREEA